LPIRLAISELDDAYAYCADRRDIDGQMSLFNVDCEFLVIHGRRRRGSKRKNWRP